MKCQNKNMSVVKILMKRVLIIFKTNKLCLKSIVGTVFIKLKFKRKDPGTVLTKLLKKKKF